MVPNPVCQLLKHPPISPEFLSYENSPGKLQNRTLLQLAYPTSLFRTSYKSAPYGIFLLEYKNQAIHPEALRFCEKARVHPLMLWMSDHGDYQSLLFVSPKNMNQIRRLTKDLIVLGEVVKDSKKAEVLYQGMMIRLPMNMLQSMGRSLASLRRGNLKMQRYFRDI